MNIVTKGHIDIDTQKHRIIDDIQNHRWIQGHRDKGTQRYIDKETYGHKDIGAQGLRDIGGRAIRTTVHKDKEAQGFHTILNNNHYILRDMWTWGDGDIGQYEHNNKYVRFYTK